MRENKHADGTVNAEKPVVIKRRQKEERRRQDEGQQQKRVGEPVRRPGRSEYSIFLVFAQITMTALLTKSCRGSRPIAKAWDAIIERSLIASRCALPFLKVRSYF